MTYVPRLPDEQQWLVDQLSKGERLVGPVRVPGPGNTTQPRPWGFASGKRAHKHSVESLQRRGILRIHDDGNQRQAVLSTAREG